MKAKDDFRFSGKIPKEGIDYVETTDTFTIFNVPILAEMVQKYTDGRALKSSEEILKVAVDNIPLTIVDYAPTHPNHLENLNTLEKSEVTAGYMSEPSKPKKDSSKTKRYADFVLYNTPKIDAFKKVYKSGSYIDTSIGFHFDTDKTPGKFLGLDYDYVQRNIRLDHNAILISRDGMLGTGRMPSPIGGIGADNKEMDVDIRGTINGLVDQLVYDNIDVTKNIAYEIILETIKRIRYENGFFDNGDDKMSENKEMDALIQENADLKKQLDELKSKDSKDAVDKIQSELDSAKTEVDKLKVEAKDAKDELDKVKADLKVFQDKEAEELKVKTDALKEHYVENAELFDKADAEYINKKYDELQKKQSGSRDIGTDMIGIKTAKLADDLKTYEKVYGKKE